MASNRQRGGFDAREFLRAKGLVWDANATPAQQQPDDFAGRVREFLRAKDLVLDADAENAFELRAEHTGVEQESEEDVIVHKWQVTLEFFNKNTQKRERIIGRGKSPNNMAAKTRAHLEILERLKLIFDSLPEAYARAGAAPSTSGQRKRQRRTTEQLHGHYTGDHMPPPCVRNIKAEPVGEPTEREEPPRDRCSM